MMNLRFWLSFWELCEEVTASWFMFDGLGRAFLLSERLWFLLFLFLSNWHRSKVLFLRLRLVEVRKKIWLNFLRFNILVLYLLLGVNLFFLLIVLLFWLEFRSRLMYHLFLLFLTICIVCNLIILLLQRLSYLLLLQMTAFLKRFLFKRNMCLLNFLSSKIIEEVISICMCLLFRLYYLLRRPWNRKFFWWCLRLALYRRRRRSWSRFYYFRLFYCFRCRFFKVFYLRDSFSFCDLLGKNITCLLFLGKIWWFDLISLSFFSCFFHGFLLEGFKVIWMAL